jgi:hypothetical protein
MHSHQSAPVKIQDCKNLVVFYRCVFDVGEMTTPAEPTVWHARPTFELVRRRQITSIRPATAPRGAKQEGDDDDDGAPPTTLASCLPSLNTGSHKI